MAFPFFITLNYSQEASDGKTELKKVKEEVISERRSLEVDLEEEKNNSRHLQVSCFIFSFIFNLMSK